MCEWKSATDTGYACRVPAEPGSPLCILHEAGSKSSAGFREALYQQFDQAGDQDELNARFDFTGYVFPSLLSVEDSRDGTPWCTLPRAVHSNLVFREVELGGGGLELEGLDIEGDLVVADSKLRSISLSDLSVSKGIHILNTSVERSFVMRGVEAGEAIRIGRSVCRGPLVISGLKLPGVLSLRRTLLRGGASLDGVALFYAEYTDVAVFDHFYIAFSEFGTTLTVPDRPHRCSLVMQAVQIEGGVYVPADRRYDSIRLRELSMTGSLDLGMLSRRERSTRALGHLSATDVAVGGNASVSGIVVSGSMRIDNVDIQGCFDLRNASFQGSTSVSRLCAGGCVVGEGKPTTAWWVKNRRGLAIAPSPGTASVWKTIRTIFSESDEREKADAAYYFERIARQRANLEVRGLRWFVAILAYCVDLVALRLSSAYGTSIARVGATWIAVIGAFGTAFSAAPSLVARSVENVWNLENWVIGFQFSVTTFTTLGLGDIYPERLLGRLLTSLEAVLGGVIMALTVLVIGRKFMR